MPRQLNAGATAERWARKTQGASADYLTGARNPRTPWQAATIAADSNYKAGVQASIASGAFAKGVQNAGDAAYMQGVADKGSLRYAEGTSVAQPKYAARIQPYLDTISATQLPPRGPRGSPANIQRVAVLAAALRKKKMGT